MTQAQLEDEVADATGESLDLIHDLGFSLMADDRTDPHPEALYLVVNCPHCRRAALYPGQLPDGSHPMAGCPGCDALFDYDIRDVFVATTPRG